MEASYLGPDITCVVILKGPYPFDYMKHIRLKKDMKCMCSYLFEEDIQDLVDQIDGTYQYYSQVPMIYCMEIDPEDESLTPLVLQKLNGRCMVVDLRKDGAIRELNYITVAAPKKQQSCLKYKAD